VSESDIPEGCRQLDISVWHTGLKAASEKFLFIRLKTGNRLPDYITACPTRKNLFFLEVRDPELNNTGTSPSSGLFLDPLHVHNCPACPGKRRQEVRERLLGRAPAHDPLRTGLEPAVPVPLEGLQDFAFFIQEFYDALIVPHGLTSSCTDCCRKTKCNRVMYNEIVALPEDSSTSYIYIKIVI
jgi:hypothetical protein